MRLFIIALLFAISYAQTDFDSSNNQDFTPSSPYLEPIQASVESISNENAFFGYELRDLREETTEAPSRGCRSTFKSAKTCCENGCWQEYKSGLATRFGKGFTADSCLDMCRQYDHGCCFFNSGNGVCYYKASEILVDDVDEKNQAMILPCLEEFVYTPWQYDKRRCPWPWGDIKSSDECESAATSLGITFSSVGASFLSPSWCTMSENEAYFNREDSGVLLDWRKPLCRQNECGFLEIHPLDCPEDRGASLKSCDENLIDGELCEADSSSSVGIKNYNINNCGLYDVFRYICPQWVIAEEFGPCSVTCGIGIQSKEITCSTGLDSIV